MSQTNQHALHLVHRQLSGRSWMVFFGLVSFLAGVAVLAFLLDSIVTLGLVVGIWLFVHASRLTGQR